MSFFFRYMTSYNECVEEAASEGGLEFTICEKNTLSAELNHVYDTVKFYNHDLFSKAFYLQRSYTACVYISSTDVHVCNAFPVMLGSDLDLRLLHKVQGHHGAAATDQDESLCSCRVDVKKYNTDAVHLKGGAAAYAEILKNNHFLTTTLHSVEYFSQVYGYFLIGGRLAWIPNVLVNNREFIHKMALKSVNNRKRRFFVFKCKPTGTGSGGGGVIKKKATVRPVSSVNFLKYIYTSDYKGHLITLSRDINETYTLVHRNHFGSETIDRLDESLFNLNIPAAMMDRRLSSIIAVFEDVAAGLEDLDKLQNKIIYTPVMLLNMLLRLLAVDPKSAVRVVCTGNWYSLCSATTQFVLNTQAYKKRMPEAPSKNFIIKHYKKLSSGSDRKSNTDSVTIKPDPVSNAYKKPTASNVGSREKFLYVGRAAIANLSTQVIPTHANGFLCPLDRGTNLDSFNKQYVLLPDVEIFTFHHQTKLGLAPLADVLRSLIAKGYAVRQQQHLNRRIVINGGLPTEYALVESLDFIKFFLFVKRLNRHIEVAQYGNRVVMLNSLEGMPFKLVNFNYLPFPLAFSPYELEKYFETFGSFYSLFCPICPPSLMGDLTYLKMCKILYSLNYLKNLVVDVRNFPLVLFTDCSHGWFMYNPHTASDGTNCIESNAIATKTLIMVEPMCTQDGYLMNPETNKVLYFFSSRFSIHIQYTNEDNVFLTPNEALKIETHLLANNASIFIYLGEIQNRLNKLNIIKNHNICVASFDLGNGNFSHHLYVYIEQFCGHAPLYPALIRSIATIYPDGVQAKKTILQIECYFQYVVNTYDGKKITNLCGSKGLVNENLNFKKKLKNYTNATMPDVIVSPFSVLSRAPVPQILEMLDESERQGSTMVAGTNNANVLANSGFQHRNTTFMRFDNHTTNMLGTNGCFRTLYTIIQNSFPKAEQFTHLPQKNREIFQLLPCLKKSITLTVPETGDRIQIP
ncbi:RNA polymerase subunit lef-8 [Cotesia congregata filamentous virus 1]|uniref:RNA polymerase subunit lef-8 n=1 Tax=Cotesia congregata filamentous virus 1 TaxID=3064291 RepID=A0ABC8QJN4_9VIRU|nr:RNA polymerase subunit lef-8 [Cotesia congregata filamentous virus 1]